MRPVKLTLCIAGESVEVLYNGTEVTSADFPGSNLHYTAPCGAEITQNILVKICASKVSEAKMALGFC